MNTAFLHHWPGHEGRLFHLLLIVLVLLLARSLASLTWQLATPAPTIETTLSPPPATVGPAASPVNPAGALAARQLFGPPAGAHGIEPVTDAPETRLDLKLVGVFASEDSSALAIIASGRQPETVYGIGDTLPGNATLRAVYADRVILERGGVLETLRLPRESLGSGMSLETRGNTAATSMASELQRYRREAIRNPARMAEAVTAEPVEENGRFIGYRLTPKRDLEIFRQLGLQPGDIITQANGIALDKPGAGIQALRKLATARELDITVLRNGTPQNIQAEFGR